MECVQPWCVRSRPRVGTRHRKRPYGCFSNRSRTTTPKLIPTPCTNERRSRRRTTPTTFLGWPIFRNKFRLRHRRPVETPAGFKPTIGSVPPSNSQPQPVRHPRRRPRSPSKVEWSPCGDCHNFGPPVCKCPDITVACIDRNILGSG